MLTQKQLEIDKVRKELESAKTQKPPNFISLLKIIWNDHFGVQLLY